MAKNIIELNGKRYDALSGKIVADTALKPKPVSITAPRQGTNLDGFASPKRHATKALKQPSAVVHNKTQASNTLMRKSVRKPQPIIKAPTHHHAAVAHHAVPAQASIAADHLTSAERWARAKKMHQSKLISRFNGDAPRTVGQASMQSVPVANVPGEAMLGKVAAHSVAPFQKALDQATSHQQPRLKKARLHHRAAKKLHVSPRILSVSSAALALLLIGGFIAYQNVPNMAMRVASTRAGVHASLPSYKPAGFGFSGPIQYKPGQITVNFKNNSDQERNFSITQSASQWNSQTLLQNYVMTNSKAYQTFEEKGKTIYIYNGSNATWVDGGIWYNVQGNSSLNSDQLLRIANSI